MHSSASASPGHQHKPIRTIDDLLTDVVQQETHPHSRRPRANHYQVMVPVTGLVQDFVHNQTMAHPRLALDAQVRQKQRQARQTLGQGDQPFLAIKVLVRPLQLIRSTLRSPPGQDWSN